MKFNEPKHTLDWTAYHIFDKLFQAKYETGKLTMNEYCNLINTVVARRTEHIAKNRKWYQFRLRWKDRVFLKYLNNLKSTLEPPNYKKQNTWGGKPLNTSKNAVV